jgi:hypothetical protein
MSWPRQVDAAQQDAPISWEGAADAYLEGDLPSARRVLDLPPEEMAERARIALGAWAGAAADFRAEERRRAVCRLQASAALALEIPEPLTAQGRVGAALFLESIAETALKILRSREIAGMAPPADRDGRTPNEIRKAMAMFRGRWNVAFLQLLVNDRRLTEAGSIAEQVVLPEGDRALPEAFYLRGLIFETNTRRLHDPRFPRAQELLPPSNIPWINRHLGDAADWYRRTLAATPHQEARLHLGRVELERGRHSRALDVLQPLREAAASSWIGGLAWLFTGASHVALGSVDDAQRAFERASHVPEVWQSARVALMQLALRQGNLAGAAETSMDFAAPQVPADNRPDAWSVYLSGRRPDDTAVLGPMREAILP